ncbi:hypothetical protein NMY22_g12920 [Coprinellus aureogranulatus]|nr:hypothetical protein NMY22_g12920 [Coprinellus aureogranulatus]
MSTNSGLKRLALLAGTISAAWIVKAILSRRRRNPRRLPYPPGPKGWPIVGNMFQVPKNRPWEGYHALCQQYGDLVYLNAMGQGILILGSRRRAEDLLEDRAANYSDRPSAVIQDLADANWSFGLMPYGSWWRKHRATFQHFFRRRDLSQWHPIMYEERDRFLSSMKETPEDYYEHMKSLFAMLVMRVSYGFEDPKRNKARIDNSQRLMIELGEARKPARFLVNVLPILRYVPGWVPGAGFQQHFKRLAAMSHEVRNTPFEIVQRLSESGEHSRHHSLAATLLDHLPEEGDPSRPELETVAKNVSASAFFAGSDTVNDGRSARTTVGTDQQPRCAKQGTAGARRSGGAHRLPLISDRNTLPYCQAIVKEAGRWFNALPIATARLSTEDDEYDGYFIPKGTFVLPLTWRIMHDPELFERPHDFVPERYLKNGEIDPSVPDATYAVFGYGRRICPGMHFSNDALFMFMTGFLSTFNISAPLDEAGKPIRQALYQMDIPVIARAAPFECKISPRI